MFIVGMSGGVDSSVSAHLLSQSHPSLVRGVFMHNWEDGVDCRVDDDRADALRICSSLSIPFITRNFSAQYKQSVFNEFLDGYAKGITPNPDILCNREVKFKVFLDDALEMGASFLATGHYAQKAFKNGQYVLLRGVDPTKDQSYFLHAITQDALAKTLFPIGHLNKDEVRDIARKNNLITAQKKDSTGICFIGERDFKDFLSTYLPAGVGVIKTVDGIEIGKHQGALYYTIGQRAPVGGVKGFSSSPWFVLEKNVHDNTLIVGQGRDHPSLFSSCLTVRDISWIAKHPPASTFVSEVQIRHLGQAIDGDVKINDDGTALVNLHSPHFAPAKGQYAVFYQGEVCLGGGMIA